ncbi:dihydrofolate synthetase-like [Zingiber officinale]|uniref:dihydrofolate synthetase-like n=1 Tax=Zingiber officinale TaxID=94328 RepID=UPI001C4D4530|nr:dihydrofolate synthetase-like [Zingiber officinale]
MSSPLPRLSIAALSTPNPKMLRRFAAAPVRFRYPTMMMSSSKTCESRRPASLEAVSEAADLREFLDYMERLKNYEMVGVPQGAGTDTDEGFDLGRMRRLLGRLGDPHKQFKVVHIAGTKGKGSTSAFISNILREEGYSVGCYTSPHLLSVRERISVGKSGNPVSAILLQELFQEAKGILDQLIIKENEALSHFEVFTALSFLLFAKERVDIAVIEAGLGGARDATNVVCSTELATAVITSIGEEHLAALGGSLQSIALAKSGIIKSGCPVVIGGPFESHIEEIIRHKASLMKSKVISTCDPGIQKTSKCLTMGKDEIPYQTCDIQIQMHNLQSSITLSNVKLHLLGIHQLQNAISAVCTALSLRDQGWVISDKSIRVGLEKTRLNGRSQFLTQREILRIGLSDVNILIDGAHTEASAKGLVEVIKMAHPHGTLAFLVAMASDKDHLSFAKQLLSAGRPELVVLTEVKIAGGKSRMVSASVLKDVWVKTSKDLGMDFVDIGIIDDDKSEKEPNCKKMMLATCKSTSIIDSIKHADQLLKSRSKDHPGLIVVTGSLHLVASLLAAIQK